VKYILDTCVISELVAKRPNPGVVAWIDSVDADDVYLSVITIGEITKGVEKLPASRRKENLRSWLKDELLVRFQDRLVDLDVEALRIWGKLNARLGAEGQKMPAVDSLIAASALTGDFTLVTHNDADFSSSGVRLLDPWIN
jgi:tRNA(fMet)-specific endonuclease VapC